MICLVDPLEWPRSHRDREWLDFVADMMTTPLISWPHERAAGLLVDTFDAPASTYYSHSGDLCSCPRRDWSTATERVSMEPGRLRQQ